MRRQATACSQACAEIVKAKALAGTVRWCKWCAAAYEPTKNDQVFCSRRCRIRADSNTKQHRRRSVFVERVSIGYLMERDGGRCGICHKPIDPTLRHPHPMSPTIDHIVPVTKGGEHSKANTQPAHLSCNSRKKNRVAYAHRY